MFLDELRTRGNRMVKVPIMQVVNMTRMFNRSVAALLAMLMSVVGVGAGGTHKIWGMLLIRK